MFFISTNIKEIPMPRGLWVNSEDNDVSGHPPRFNSLEDTNKQLGIGASHG
jgi:hypothetical protein